MSPDGHRPLPRVAPAGRPGLGSLAGPAPATSVPVDDHALQVPLVAALLVADGELGRPLLRPDPLADRRARAGESVSTHGGRFAVDDDRTIPDTSRIHLRARLGDAHAFSACSRPTASPSWAAAPRSSCGARSGTVYCERPGLRDRPRARRRSSRIRSPGGRAEVVKATDGDLDQQAARDFLDNVKGRKRPAADIEEGHRSTTFAHLANIALATRKRLEWDHRLERFTHCDEANQLLHYEYRKPWSLA